jgi:hypothetical protein
MAESERDLHGEDRFLNAALDYKDEKRAEEKKGINKRAQRKAATTGGRRKAAAPSLEGKFEPVYTDHIRAKKDKARKKILNDRKTAFYK